MLTALRNLLRRPESDASATEAGDYRDLVALFNEARTEADVRYASSLARGRLGGR